MTYSDDRPGMMRVHIAEERGRLACERYTRDALRAHAKGHGLIDADGYLRDGFPRSAS